MEVGIEDCLHIEFEYDKSKYHLKDTVVGKIYFLLVRFCRIYTPISQPFAVYESQPAIQGYWVLSQVSLC